VPEAARLGRVRAVLEHLVRRGDPAINAFLRYVQGAVSVDVMPVFQAVVRELAPHRESAMISIAEHYMQQGREQGREQGLEQGLAQGRALGLVDGLRLALASLLRARFGALLPGTDRQLAEADAATLQQCLERAVTATSLEDVFPRVDH
jgi:hypothetical protein